MPGPDREPRITFVCRMILAGAFTWLLIAKLDAARSSAHGVLRGASALGDVIARQYLIAKSWSLPVAWSLLLLEAGIIAWLVSAIAPRRSLTFVLVFLIGVCVYLGAVAEHTGTDTPCGCTGSSRDMVAGALIRNAALAAIAGSGS